MFLFLQKVMRVLPVCVVALMLFPPLVHSQGGEQLPQSETKPWLEKLDPRQQSAFVLFFNALASIDSAEKADIASLTVAWDRVMTAFSGAEASPSRIEAWCHLAMVAYKRLLDKVGFIQGTALAKLIFSDGFKVLQSIQHDNYEAWADLCRMKDYEIQQYANLHGIDEQAVEMSRELERWGKTHPVYWARYQTVLAGGICPTFVQPPPGGGTTRPLPDNLHRALFASIAIPSENCLLRSDIPIFGIAGGENFKRYVVEYAASGKPSVWHLIEESELPQNHFSFSRLPDLMQGDLDLRGNLATWNVGLKNWEHLPWHRASDTTDLNGVYTIRLTVTGRDGETVEDHVTCEVGRVIAQCRPGLAVSANRKVTMHFPEQALTAPFRVFAIRPVTGEAPALPERQKLIDEVYQIREGGDRFIKPVILKMSYASSLTTKDHQSSFGIFAYNAAHRSWALLKTVRNDDQMVLHTELMDLSAPKAYFAILSSTEGLVQSVEEKQGIPAKRTVSLRNPASERILVKDDFETGLGEWSGRDAEAGASVSRIRAGGRDTNYYVEVSKKSQDGNFACNVTATPFDARDYPLVSFDYKIGRGTEIDFYIRVAGRWYDIGFTESAADYRNKDVNIAYLGRIPDILADGFWHHAEVDIRDFLRQRTRNTLVDAIVLADWKVGGYMNLEFGHTAKDATVCFDNFTISRGWQPITKPRARGDSLIVEDFEGDARSNYLGGDYTTFSSPGRPHCSVELIDRRAKATGGDKNRCLLVRYDVQRSGEYGGWLTSLEGANLEGCTYLSFEIYAQDSMPKCLIGLKSTRGEESKVPLRPYLGEPRADGWRLATIPLVAFSSLIDFAAMDNFSISFEEKCGSDSGRIQVDNVQFCSLEKGRRVLKIEDFEDSIPNANALGARNWEVVNGAAAIRAEKQMSSETTHQGGSMRISYGGSIGLDLGEAGFSYAGWTTGLGGIDLSSFDSFCFSVRGQKGGEEFNVYLDDGNKRWPVAVTKYGTVAKAWNTISVPLKEYIDHGVDVTHANELQFVFEWKEMSGTIWVDDIAFEHGMTPSPITAGQSGGNRRLPKSALQARAH